MRMSTAANWTHNAWNQSSCDVASTLASACVGEVIQLGDIQQGRYLGPSISLATPCMCNTVFYSLMCACASCQGIDYIRFPRDMPSNITVPGWAYLDVETEDIFNAVLAQSLVGSLPDVFPTLSSRTQHSIAPSEGYTASTPGPSVVEVNGDANPRDGGRDRHVIAGGAVGGVFGVTLIIWLIIFLVRANKKGNNKLPSILRRPDPINDPLPAQPYYNSNHALSFAHYGPRTSIESDDISLQPISGRSITTLSVVAQA